MDLLQIERSIRYSATYSTLKGKTYPIELGLALLPAQNIRVDARITREACKKGCRLYGHNGGCPPFAPEFNQIPGEEMLVLYAKLLTEHFPPRVISGPYYSRWVFVETLLTPLTNRLGKMLMSSLSGYFLSSGNCQSCRPKRCAVKDGHNCRDPIGRTFSLESTGVLVTELMKDLMGLELQWWKRDDPLHIPSYMVKVVGIKGDRFIDRGFTPDAITRVLFLQERLFLHE